MATQKEYNQAKDIPEFCPECGGELKSKVSFKGKNPRQNKRKSIACSYCGWSDIIKTDREAVVQIGIHDND